MKIPNPFEDALNRAIDEIEEQCRGITYTICIDSPSIAEAARMVNYDHDLVHRAFQELQRRRKEKK